MLDLVTLATKGTKSPAGQSSVIAAFSRFVLVAVHGELPRQAAGMCAALLARTVAATVVTERNGKPPCVQAASPPGRRKSASPLGCRRGGTCMFAANTRPIRINAPINIRATM